MRLTIVVPDSNVGVDGEFKKLNLASMDENIHAVQWNGTRGHIEYNDGTINEQITDINQFSDIVDQWYSITPEVEELEPETPEQALERIRQQRKAAYEDEADPLYFKAQRGEATMEDWLAKVEEIKQRYPEV
jgi:hypothetical protein